MTTNAFTYYGGKGSYIRGNKHICGDEKCLEIGKYCSIAEDVHFLLNGHRGEWFSTYPFGVNNKQTYTGKIIIKNDVWIGYGAIILYGSIIEDGAIVAAGSVVRGRVKAYTVVGGNPAQFLYTRFNNEVIEILKQLKWWDRPMTDDIKDALQSNNIEKLKKLL